MLIPDSVPIPPQLQAALARQASQTSQASPAPQTGDATPTSSTSAPPTDAQRLTTLVDLVRQFSTTDISEELRTAAQAILQGRADPTQIALLQQTVQIQLAQQATSNTSNQLFRQLLSAFAGNDFPAAAETLRQLTPQTQPPSDTSGLRTLQALRELAWLGTPAELVDSDPTQRSQDLARQLANIFPSGWVAPTGSVAPPSTQTPAPVLDTPWAQAIRTLLATTAAPTSASPTPTTSPTATTLASAPTPPILPASLPQQWLVAENDATPPILYEQVDSRVLADPTLPASIPAATLREAVAWVQSAGLPVTANTVDNAVFLMEYPDMPRSPSLLRDFSALVHAASLTSDPGQPVDDERKDFLLRALVTYGEKPPSPALLRSILTYTPSSDPEPQTFLRLPQSLQQQTASLLQGKPILTPGELERTLQEALQNWKEQSHPSRGEEQRAERLLQQLQQQLVHTRVDQDSRHPTDRQEVFYWFQEGQLHKGRMKVRDQRDEHGDGKPGSGGILGFTVETHLPSLGKVRAEFSEQGGMATLWVEEESGNARPAMDAERESLAEDLQTIGWTLVHLGWRPLRDDSAAAAPNTPSFPAPFDNGRPRLDVRI